MASGSLAMPDATASSDLSARVAQALQPYFAEDKFPGISVAVVTDGKVALAQGYGISNVATGAHVQANTRFDIGSVTKTFTAIGVLLLDQDSQGTSHPLNLDAPIGDYLHNTKSFTLPPRWSQVTTRELLDMTSGIPEVGSARPWQAQVAAIAKDPLLFTPGTKSMYSDTNYDLLGELIEQWTGETYGTFLENQILTPLGMTETQELGQSPTVANQAVGYNAPRNGRVAEGRGPERTRNVRRRRNGLDGPGYGHLYDGTPERTHPQSHDLRADVVRDTDAGIRGDPDGPTPCAGWDGIR